MKYNVDVYLSGHDHILSHTFKHNIHFIVSGMGCFSTPFHEDRTFTCALEPGIAYLKPSEHEFEFGFINKDGDMVRI
jgi:hypothetical protein